MQNKIYRICKQVLKITEDEITEVKEIYEGQLSYINPLKMATTGKQRELGEHNKQVLEKLLELKAVLESGVQN